MNIGRYFAVTLLMKERHPKNVDDYVAQGLPSPWGLWVASCGLTRQKRKPRVWDVPKLHG